MTPAHGGRDRLREVLWSLRREFLAVGLFSGVANLLMLTPTVYMMQVYDRVMLSQSELTLLALSLIALFLLGALACAEWFRSRVLVRAGLRLDRELATGVFEASFDAALRQGGQQAPARAFADLTQVRQFVTGTGVFAFFDLPWVPVYVAVSFFLHPVLGEIALVFVAVQVLLAWLGHRQTVVPADEAARAATEATVFLQAKLRNAETIEAMGMQPGLRRRWQERQAAAIASHTRSQRIALRVTSVSKFIRYSQQSLILATGALLVIDGQLTAGTMIASNLLVARALAPIDMVVTGWRAFASAAAAYRRLRELLRTSAPAAAASHAEPRGALRLRGLVASAPGRPAPILKNIDLDIEAGQTVVVLGPSGSGKSTLARCLLGIWPQVAGEVLLDGAAVASWRREALGPHLGYLPQDVELFDGTVAENIARMAEPDPQKVIAAARASGLHETILRLPRGYDTPIGEAGGALSAGQRQRLALARALYGAPALLVLDEPDANLDDAGEQALAGALRELRRAGRTVVLITHRRALVNLADRMLLLRDGQVAAFGPPAAVLAALAPAAGNRAALAQPRPA